MTEDDTFNALIKISFHDMKHVLDTHNSLSEYVYYDEIPDVFYQRYGWKKSEFLQIIDDLDYD